MNRTRITTAAVIGFAALGGGLWMYRRAEASEAPSYRYAQVERGSLQATVSATGTLGAVRTVQVGTQVSGQVSAIHADFNDRVTKGQLIARIDPTLQQQAVQDAQAGLERAQAQLDLAKDEYDRNRTLFDDKIVTASEFGSTQSAYAVAKANVKSAQISLDRARQNLAYTNVYAPIDGVVVERNVDVGQTVAASLSAPQLFLIANDLTEMQILASVDESDIGKIKEGQSVSFSVQSYANETFTGTVKQVRLQSATTENVVNYTAVVAVRNPDKKLLPGMTATVKFLTSSADDVLTVPNAALRFQPAAGGATTAATTPAQPAGGTGTPRVRPTGAGSGSAGTLWYLDETGKLAAARVRTGLNDGQRTQVQGQGIEAGMKVIVGAASGTASAAAATPATTNPLQPQQTQQRGPRPPGAF